MLELPKLELGGFNSPDGSPCTDNHFVHAKLCYQLSALNWPFQEVRAEPDLFDHPWLQGERQWRREVQPARLRHRRAQGRPTLTDQAGAQGNQVGISAAWSG